jgi:hypothetical protein
VNAYRAQDLTREEMAARDPFGGQGVFLPAPGMAPGDILARVKEALGPVHAVAWGEIGAWVSPGSSGMNAATVRDQWNGGGASEYG